jgi:hypothetical protein
MVISEKIHHASSCEVRLYKEGVFWIAYEQSAYLISLVKALKPTKKLVKKLGKEVISVGFPDSSLEKIISLFALKERNGTLVVMETDSPCDEIAYRQWKDQTETTIPVPAAVAPQQTTGRETGRDLSVTERLLSFDIGNSTPMQCFVFLNELQQNIIKMNGALREPAGL